jgi:hypothetical protein
LQRTTHGKINLHAGRQVREYIAEDGTCIEARTPLEAPNPPFVGPTIFVAKLSDIFHLQDQRVREIPLNLDFRVHPVAFIERHLIVAAPEPTHRLVP